MINIEFNPNTYTLDVTGHAEHGKKGEDIVCSAISTLFYTLAESINKSSHMLKEEMEFNNDDGNGHISCKPKEEYEANISLIFWTILNGFKLIADNYEKNVAMVVVG
jgi:uncharacterized protein YsxB (DUF464 family)